MFEHQLLTSGDDVIWSNFLIVHFLQILEIVHLFEVYYA